MLAETDGPMGSYWSVSRSLICALYGPIFSYWSYHPLLLAPFHVSFSPDPSS
jgi:hypothetical protein